MDATFNRHFASALRSAGWSILSVQEAFGVSPQRSVKDPQVISRCADEGRIWVTADRRARFQHENALKTNFVSVLWIRQPEHAWRNAYALACLAVALLRIDHIFDQRKDEALHLRVSWTIGAEPEEVWSARRR